MQLVDGGLACQCSHLSEFISLKVPTDFEDTIQFANLDVPTEACLHCACTKGVELLLEKSDDPGTTNRILQVCRPARVRSRRVAAGCCACPALGKHILSAAPSRAVLQEVDLRNLDIGYHDGAIAWRLHNITQLGQPTAMEWVSLVQSQGRALGAGETSDKLQLAVSPAGLAETSAADG